MKSDKAQSVSRNIKKGIAAIVVGVLIAAGGVSMNMSPHTAVMVAGWVLDIFGVLLALSGMGLLAGTLSRKDQK